MSAGIVAFGAVSAMGQGEDAVSAGEVGERARLCVTLDEELTKAGLARPHAARADVGSVEGDRATVLLLRAMTACIRELDVVLPSWRTMRVGLVLGTSSGGMRTAETLYASLLASPTPLPSNVDTAGAFYFSPMADVVRTLGFAFEPATLVMGACAASTVALGVGLRWLEADACDLVLAGGFDAVSPFVATGFEVLRATTATLPPRPFREGRDGMALGEGAAVVALRLSSLVKSAKAHVTGFGASSDAVHLTAPDREGRGLARAARAALTEAGLTSVDLVSPHGSATPFSDAAEAKALAEVLPAIAHDVLVHPFKAQIGHTLGASGALEALACVDALSRGLYPAAAGEGALDPDAHAHMLETTREGTPRTALKLSAAFGGLNAALVVSRDPGPSRSPKSERPVFLRAPVHVHDLPAAADLAKRIAWPVERVLRADMQARWTLAAVSSLVERDGPLTGAGILVGTPFATMETNASFFNGIQERGARMAEPRKFPYTSPNAAAGDAGVAFGLTGPSFAVGSGLHAALEAFALATQLIRAGDVDTMIVAGIDDVGGAALRVAHVLGIDVEAGAVGLVLSASPEHAIARVGAVRYGVGMHPSDAPHPCGHQALLPLLASPLPTSLDAMSPDLRVQGGGAPVAWARIELLPLALSPRN